MHHFKFQIPKFNLKVFINYKLNVIYTMIIKISSALVLLFVNKVIIWNFWQVWLNLFSRRLTLVVNLPPNAHCPELSTMSLIDWKLWFLAKLSGIGNIQLLLWSVGSIFGFCQKILVFWTIIGSLNVDQNLLNTEFSFPYRFLLTEFRKQENFWQNCLRNFILRLSDGTQESHLVWVPFLQTFCSQQVSKCHQRQVQIFNFNL